MREGREEWEGVREGREEGSACRGGGGGGGGLRAEKVEERRLQLLRELRAALRLEQEQCLTKAGRGGTVSKRGGGKVQSTYVGVGQA